jgi:hypothetical protein
MRRYVIAVVGSIAGYVVAAVVGYTLVGWFSANPHDRSVEAAMTAAFVFGPIGAILAFILGLVFGGKTHAPRDLGAP